MIPIHTGGADTAKACFQENVRLFGNAQTDPEKYNLYNGLMNLAEAVEKLEKKLKKIETELQRKVQPGANPTSSVKRQS